MIFKVQLTIDGLDNPITVSNVRWRTSKIVDHGLEMSAPEPSDLYFEVSDYSILRFFYDWTKEINSRKNGRVEYFDAVTGKMYYTLSFTEALCSGMTLRFSKNTTTPFYSIITIHYSRKNYLFEPGLSEAARAEAAPATSAVEEEGTITRCYMEDESGQEIQKAKRGQVVYAIVETEGMEGKTVTIDLSDDEVVYEYQGAPLDSDQITGLIVSGDQLRVELTCKGKRQ